MRLRLAYVALAIGLLPALASAQDDAQPPSARLTYVPPTPRERVTWVIEGTASLPVLGVNALDAAWSTRANWPKEWGRKGSGFGKRLADDEAFATVSDAIEAGVGAFWGEDPRYRRSGDPRTWHRVGHALAATVLTSRRDGRVAPAWARFVAEATATQIENTWLPRSARTPGETAWRAGSDLLWCAAANVWDEFWPDIRKRLPASQK